MNISINFVFKKAVKGFGRHTRNGLVVDPDGNTLAVAASDAEAARKSDLVRQTAFLNSSLEQFDDLFRVLEMAR